MRGVGAIVFSTGASVFSSFAGFAFFTSGSSCLGAVFLARAGFEDSTLAGASIPNPA